MITEELLERGLHSAAEGFDIPAGAVDRLRAHLETGQPVRRVRVRRIRRPSTRLSWAMAGLALLAVVVGLPLALGGGPPSAVNEAGGASGSATAPVVLAPKAAPSSASGSSGAGSSTSESGSGSGAGTAGSVSAAPASPPRGTTNGPVSTVPAAQDRVVKTGTLALRAAAGQVAPTLQRLTDLATGAGGYVESSTSNTAGTDPSGELVLRVPVARFESTVNQAQHLSDTKVLSLHTAGQDVTGQYVDLKARIHALQQTRSTYLTILSRATTIGQTLVVQSHINDVQSNIEQLQGQLKLLRNHSAMSTLTVDVDQPVSPLPVQRHHSSTGFGHAVSLSIARFNRGVDVIVGLIGPLLLTVLIVGVLGVIGRLGVRALRRRLV